MAESTQAKTLSKKDVVRAFWRWTFFSHANYNYERLEATGLVHSFKHVIKKLYGDDPVEYKACIKRHMQFFNTEPHIGGCIPGIVLAMEEQRANGAPITEEAINGTKTGLMGPFAGIGDTLWQGTLTPILLSVGISIGQSGNLLGPIAYTIAMYAIMLPVAYICWMQGYRLGAEGIQKVLSGNMLQKIITGASAMGAMVLGALTADNVTVTCPAVISIGEMQLAIQTDVLDTLFLGLIPMAITLGTLWLLRDRQMKSTTVMLILVILGIITGGLGIFAV